MGHLSVLRQPDCRRAEERGRVGEGKTLGRDMISCPDPHVLRGSGNYDMFFDPMTWPTGMWDGQSSIPTFLSCNY